MILTLCHILLPQDQKVLFIKSKSKSTVSRTMNCHSGLSYIKHNRLLLSNTSRAVTFLRIGRLNINISCASDGLLKYDKYIFFFICLAFEIVDYGCDLRISKK